MENKKPAQKLKSNSRKLASIPSQTMRIPTNKTKQRKKHGS